MVEIQMTLDEEANLTVEIYKLVHKLQTKSEAINALIHEAEAEMQMTTEVRSILDKRIPKVPTPTK